MTDKSALIAENELRAGRALIAVKAYVKDCVYEWISEDHESVYIDLITDLMHLAKDRGVDVESVLRCAKSNFAEEDV